MVSGTEFMRDFIEVYRSLPCLWKVKSPEYCNRVLKEQAYQKLIEVAAKYFPNQTVDLKFVKTKIQNMRTVYKRELNKVEDSKRSGNATDDVYIPRIWYFDLLEFTRDHELSRPSVCVQRELATQEPYAESTGVDSCPNESEETDGTTTQPIEDGPSTSEEQSQRPAHPQRRKRKRTALDERTDRLIASAEGLLKPSDTPLDDCYHLGQVMAAKLRKMDPGQRTLFEVLLADLQGKAMMCQLEPTSFIGNSRFQQMGPMQTNSSMHQYHPPQYYGPPGQPGNFSTPRRYDWGNGSYQDL